jgi:hypothetical protein
MLLRGTLKWCSVVGSKLCVVGWCAVVGSKLCAVVGSKLCCGVVCCVGSKLCVVGWCAVVAVSSDSLGECTACCFSIWQYWVCNIHEDLNHQFIENRHCIRCLGNLCY